MARAVTSDPVATNPIAAAMAAGPSDGFPRAGGAHVTPSVLAFTQDLQALAGEVARRRAIVHEEAPEAATGTRRLQITDGPCAAAIAYALDPTGAETLLVFDLGGSFELPLMGVGQAMQHLYESAAAELESALAFTRPSRHPNVSAQELLVARPADADAVVRRMQAAPLRRGEHR
jgi:hypothetical protein